MKPTVTSPTLQPSAAPNALVDSPRRFLRRVAAYPALYTWYVFFSALDVMLTWLILSIGGREENVLADWIIQRFSLFGMTAFKFLMVVLVLVICQILAHHRHETGRAVASWAIALSAFPVVFGASQLFYLVVHGHFG